MMNALSLQLFSVLLLLITAVGFRQELLPFKAFAAVMAIATLLIIVVMFIAIIHMIKTGFGSTSLQTMLACGIGFLLLFGVGQLMLKARSVPRIHDISTDPHDPPRFERAKELRKPSDNPLNYTSEIAELQQSSYGDLRSLILPQAPEKLLPALIAVADDFGWRVHTVDEQNYRFEAASKTPLLGFTDDIVVRVAVVGKGSRVDMRSASRVGLSDLGKNAQRIREYFKAVSQTVAN